MERQIHHNTDQIDEQSEEVPVTPLKSPVTIGSVVAVFTDHSDYDYYILLVKKKMFTLNKDSTDSWGSLVRGTWVFSGLYYDRDGTNPLKYKLMTRKTAIVPAVLVVYICSEMITNNDIALLESLHLDI